MGIGLCAQVEKLQYGECNIEDLPLDQFLDNYDVHFGEDSLILCVISHHIESGLDSFWRKKVSKFLLQVSHKRYAKALYDTFIDYLHMRAYLSQKYNKWDELAFSMNGMSQGYYRLGEHYDAVKCAKEACDISIKHHIQAGLQLSYMRLGWAYSRLKRFKVGHEAAENYLKQCQYDGLTLWEKKNYYTLKASLFDRSLDAPEGKGYPSLDQLLWSFSSVLHARSIQGIEYSIN